MAERFLDLPKATEGVLPLPELKLKKLARNKGLKEIKKLSIKKHKEVNADLRKKLKIRTHKYLESYQNKENYVIKMKKNAKSKGGYYVEEEPKVLFVIRIKGINKVPPKPKMILRLFRLLQLHNGVFIKINKATLEMLKFINPYVTFGVPSLKTIRQLVYKRGYAKVGKAGCKQRIRITSNEIIRKNLGKYDLHGMEDIVHELYTCGPHFKQVSNFLWPFKLSSPRKGFVAKRHGFTETKGGDWGNRSTLINELVQRMN